MQKKQARKRNLSFKLTLSLKLCGEFSRDQQ
jgi:hypothetical protein